MKPDSRFQVYAKRMPKYGNKRWVFVNLWDKADWVPSFHDLFRIIQAICYCEDEKYPRGEGRGMVERFLIDACRRDVEWTELQEKYKIPEREG